MRVYTRMANGRSCLVTPLINRLTNTLFAENLQKITELFVLQHFFYFLPNAELRTLNVLPGEWLKSVFLGAKKTGLNLFLTSSFGEYNSNLTTSDGPPRFYKKVYAYANQSI